MDYCTEAEALADIYDCYYDEFDKEENNEKHKARKLNMIMKYKFNKTKPVGSEINCACCNKILIKKTKAQVFCSPIKKGNKKISKCKDRYWNYIDDTRNERSQRWN